MRVFHRSYWFLGLLCVFLIGARISCAHWHLCYDGQEPPAELHFGNPAFGDGNDVPGYEDADLVLVDDGIVETLKAGLDVTMLCTLFVVLWLSPINVRSIPFPLNRTPVFPDDPRSLHAPPRAPPL